MQEEAEKLVIQWGLPIVIAVCAVGIRFFFSAERLTLLGVIRGILAGIFVGTIGAMALSDIDSLSDGMKGAIIGGLVIVSEYFLVGMLKLAQIFKDDPAKLIRIFMGKK